MWAGGPAPPVGQLRSPTLVSVLGRLVHDRRVAAVALIDVTSGMVLDGHVTCTAPVDLELLGACSAELVVWAGGGSGEVDLVVSQAGTRHHVVRSVPDPHGDRLVLAVLAHCSARRLRPVLRRLRRIRVGALVTGPA